MDAVSWIGKTDTPRLSWGVNGEGYSESLNAARNAVTPENKSILFRKTVTVGERLLSATVCVCGLGFYEMYVNGQRVGDFVLTPLETDYRKRVLYDEYDVTALLQSGENALGVELGNARYSPQKKYWDWRAAWHGDPCLALRLRLRYEGGREETVETDSSWKCAYGPLVKNCFYDGEVYDARAEQPGWNCCGFDDSHWRQALPVAAPGGRLERNTYFHIQKHRTLKPETVFKHSDAKLVCLFPENISGWVRIRVKGERGAKVRLRYAEKVLNGEIDTRSNGGAENTDVYILNDKAEQTYEPRFTFRGFLAVEVTVEGVAELLSAEAYQVYAGIPRTGSFDCDAPEIMGLHDVILRTQKAALFSYPLDCPQRDERMGWLGDAHITAETCLYNFDMRQFYAKWLEDVRLSAHSKTGAIPFIAPCHWNGHAVDWSAGYGIVLWEQYLFYRDKKLLQRHCDTLIRYAEYLGSLGPILEKTRYGDWMSTAEGWVRGDPACCASLYYYYTLLILENILRILERNEEFCRFSAVAAEEKRAILARFYDPETNSFDDNTQFSLAFALKLKLIPEETVPQVLEKLLQDIRDRDYHLTTGILGTRYVMEVLVEYRQQETAIKLILQKDYPGWLALIQGKTTLSERWDGRGSQNHCMFGSVDGIFYRMLAGIRVGECIEIDPYPAKELDRVCAKVCFGDGEVGVSWRRQGEKILLSLDITGSREVLFRGKMLAAGHYEFLL